MEEFYCVIDENGVIADTSESFVQLIGTTDQNIKGKLFKEAISNQEGMGEWLTELEKDHYFKGFIISLKDASGIKRSLSISGKRLSDFQSERPTFYIYGFEISFQDRAKYLDKLRKEILRACVAGQPVDQLRELVCQGLCSIYKDSKAVVIQEGTTGDSTQFDIYPGAEKFESLIDFLQQNSDESIDHLYSNNSRLINPGGSAFWDELAHNILSKGCGLLWVGEMDHTLIGQRSLLLLALHKSQHWTDEDEVSVSEIARLLTMASDRLKDNERHINLEERYQQLVEHSPMAIAVHCNGVVKFVNSVAKAMFKYPPGESMLGKMVTDFIHPSDHEVAAQRMQSLYQREKLQNNEIRLIDWEGNMFYGMALGTPILFEGEPAVQVVFSDITQQKEAELTLLESEQRFKLALQGSEAAIWELNDMQRGTMQWADRLYEILGYKPAEIESSLNGFEQILHPEERTVVVDQVSELLKRKEKFKIECRVSTKTGTYKWVLISGMAQYDDGGSIQRVVGSLIDINQRKTLEVENERKHIYAQLVSELSAKGARANNEWFIVSEYCKALVEALGFDMVWISKNDTDEFNIPAIWAHASAKEIKYDPDIILNCAMEYPASKALQTGDKIVIDDLDNYKAFEDWRKVLVGQGISSFFSIPIKSDKETYGVLNICSSATLQENEDFGDLISSLCTELVKSIMSIRLKRKSADLNEFNQLLLDSLQVVSVNIDFHNGTISSNGKIQEMFGYTNADLKEIIKHYDQYVHPNDIQALETIMNLSMMSQGYFDAEFRLKHHTGKYVWINSIGRIHWKGSVIRKVVGILINVNQKKREEVERMKANILGRDNERSRLAKMLHNSLSQILTMASLSLDALGKDLDAVPKNQQDMYDNAYQMVNQAIEESRSISRELLPSLLMDFGIVKSIESEINRIRNNTELNIKFDYDDLSVKRFTSEIETNIYNIFREAMSNTLRHAKATEVVINLKVQEETLSFRIHDNGTGFDQSNIDHSKQIGLTTMRNRAISMGGEFILKTTGGTTITVDINCLPVEAKAVN